MYYSIKSFILWLQTLYRSINNHLSHVNTCCLFKNLPGWCVICFNDT